MGPTEHPDFIPIQSPCWGNAFPSSRPRQLLLQRRRQPQSGIQSELTPLETPPSLHFYTAQGQPNRGLRVSLPGRSSWRAAVLPRTPECPDSAQGLGGPVQAPSKSQVNSRASKPRRNSADDTWMTEMSPSFTIRNFDRFLNSHSAALTFCLMTYKASKQWIQSTVTSLTTCKFKLKNCATKPITKQITLHTEAWRLQAPFSSWSPQ